MATIRRFRKLDQGKERITAVEDAAIVLLELDGERFVQLNGYGSEDREHPGKRSKNMRLTKSAFEQLVTIGSKHFGISS